MSFCNLSVCMSGLFFFWWPTEIVTCYCVDQKACFCYLNQVTSILVLNKLKIIIIKKKNDAKQLIFSLPSYKRKKWADNVIEWEIIHRHSDIGIQLRHMEGAGQLLGWTASLKPHPAMGLRVIKMITKYFSWHKHVSLKYPIWSHFWLCWISKRCFNWFFILGMTEVSSSADNWINMSTLQEPTVFTITS